MRFRRINTSRRSQSYDSDFYTPNAALGRDAGHQANFSTLAGNFAVAKLNTGDRPMSKRTADDAAMTCSALAQTHYLSSSFPWMKTRLFVLIALLLSVIPALPAEGDQSPETALLHFPNAEVRDLMAVYGGLIGKQVIMDNTIQGQVGLDAGEKPVSREKAIKLIEQVLFVDGFSLIDVDDDIVLALGPGKMARNFAPPVYSDPTQIPRGERVFSYLVKLRNRPTLEVAAVLSQYFPPSNTTAFTPDTKSSTLVITGETGTVRRALRLVEALDATPAKSESAAAVTPAESGR